MTPDFPPSRGGIQVLLDRLAHEMLGFEVHVVTRGRAGTAGDHALGSVSRWPGGGRRASLAGLNLLSLVRGIMLRPDLVLVGHVVSGPAAVALRRLLRIPIVTYVHADEVPARAAFARLVLSRSTRVVAVSRHARDLAVGHGGLPERVSVIAPGVDVPSRGVIAAKRERPTMLTVARLADRYKGHDVVMRALPAVRAAVPDAEWIIGGDGPLGPELRSLADSLGIGASVRFLGDVSDDERDDLFDTCHVFVMPSRMPPSGGGEGFGIVYLEAAARALPSVAGNVGGALDAVVHESTGLLVDPESPAEVAAAIVDLLTNPDEARRLGEAARRRAEQFAWPTIAARVEALLHAASTRTR